MTAASAPRTVWAVDIMASVVSFARITEGVEKPSIGRAMVPLQSRTHTPRAQWKRATTLADEVVGKILKGGTPTLVVIAKQQWNHYEKDPTAQRRFMVQALIEQRLHAAEIPVAEFPYPTAATWLGVSRKGGGVMTQLAAGAAETWGISAPTEQRAEQRDDDGKVIRAAAIAQVAFRPQAVVLAAIGAMDVGIATAVPVTDERLAMVRGESNAAVQFPKNRVCPETVADWQRLHENPVLLTLEG